MRLHRIKSLRRIGLGLLRWFNPGDIRIKHHWTGDPLWLHSYRHKGYWYHGRKREQRSMKLMARMISPGDSIIEAGGHIGYISLYFASLVPDGEVHVFEPGSNNLAYIRRNTDPIANIHLVPMGLSDQAGEATMYIEDLTGQNNTLLADFEEFSQHREDAFRSDVNYDSIDIQLDTLDAYVSRLELRPGFVKIDVEGFEYEVLRGGCETLARYKPGVVVEVQRHYGPIFELMKQHGYLGFNQHQCRIDESVNVSQNLFFLHPEAHVELLAELEKG